MELHTTPLVEKESLQLLFSPAVVALIGASSKEGSVGQAIFKNLTGSGFQGTVYPVNIKENSIAGVQAYASVKDIPEAVDLAVIVVPRDAVLLVMQECAEKEVAAAVIITAGFKETGEAGRQLEEQIGSLAKKHHIELIGPNCLGIINRSEDVRLNATFAKHVPAAGNISFFSQSGAVGVYALEFAVNNDIGFNKFVSIGNKALLNENDILQALAKDASTKVIMAYLENFEAPGDFMRRTRQVTHGRGAKPVLMIKAGKSKSAQRAAASHTGALAERDEVLNDLFHQCGVIRMETMEELFDQALFFSMQPIPRGARTAIVTNAGGPAIIASDLAEKLGLEVPELPSSLQRKLKEVLPAAASSKNPVDLIGDAEEDRFQKVLESLVKSSALDIVLVICTPQMMTNMKNIARVIASIGEKAREHKKVLVAAMAAFDELPEVRKILGEAGIPNYAFAENAIRSIAGAVRFARWKTRPLTSHNGFAVDKKKARAIIQQARAEKRKFLTEPESYELFEAYGFSTAKHAVVTSVEEALEAATAIGYPVVAKIVSPDIIHKFDVGGVVTNVKGRVQLYDAYEKILKNVTEAVPKAKVKGILIQHMVTGGVETIVGSKLDKHYGQLLMFGMGGTYVEVFKDVHFRSIPISKYDAEEMIRSIHAYELLKPFRGKPGKDIDSLQDGLLRLSALLHDIPEIAEMDINPLFAMEKGVVAADARIVLV